MIVIKSLVMSVLDQTVHITYGSCSPFIIIMVQQTTTQIALMDVNGCVTVGTIWGPVADNEKLWSENQLVLILGIAVKGRKNIAGGQR